MGAQRPGQDLKTIGQMPLDDAFPAQSMEFSHNLHLDDRLTLAAVADLADRLPRRSVIRPDRSQRVIGLELTLDGPRPAS